MLNLLEVNAVELVYTGDLSDIMSKDRAVLRRGDRGRPIDRVIPAADGQEGFNVLNDS